MAIISNTSIPNNSSFNHAAVLDLSENRKKINTIETLGQNELVNEKIPKPEYYFSSSSGNEIECVGTMD